jgi:hypothetical protein
MKEKAMIEKTGNSLSVANPGSAPIPWYAGVWGCATLPELRAGRELLTRGWERVLEGWCQGTLARTEDGTAIRPQDERAASWCLYGALHQAKPRQECRAIAIVALRTASGLEWEDLAQMNDLPWMTQEKVAALFEKAIRVVESHPNWEPSK